MLVLQAIKNTYKKGIEKQEHMSLKGFNKNIIF